MQLSLRTLLFPSVSARRRLDRLTYCGRPCVSYVIIPSHSHLRVDSCPLCRACLWIVRRPVMGPSLGQGCGSSIRFIVDLHEVNFAWWDGNYLGNIWEAFRSGKDQYEFNRKAWYLVLWLSCCLPDLCVMARVRNVLRKFLFFIRMMIIMSRSIQMSIKFVNMKWSKSWWNHQANVR